MISSPPDRPKLEWDAGHAAHAAIEAFRLDVVESGIVQGGVPEALLPWVHYLWQIRVFGFALAPDADLPVPNTGYAFVEGDDDDEEEGEK